MSGTPTSSFLFQNGQAYNYIFLDTEFSKNSFRNNPGSGFYFLQERINSSVSQLDFCVLAFVSQLSTVCKMVTGTVCVWGCGLTGTSGLKSSLSQWRFLSGKVGLLTISQERILQNEANLMGLLST